MTVLLRSDAPRVMAATRTRDGTAPTARHAAAVDVDVGCDPVLVSSPSPPPKRFPILAPPAGAETAGTGSWTAAASGTASGPDPISRMRSAVALKLV